MPSPRLKGDRMKIYSAKLTTDDIRETFATTCVPVGGYIEELEFHGLSTRGQNKGKNRWTVYAGSYNGRRARNQRDGFALDWADYGRWFAELFKIDPNAWISGWAGVEKFHEGTRRQFV